MMITQGVLLLAVSWFHVCVSDGGKSRTEWAAVVPPLTEQNSGMTQEDIDAIQDFTNIHNVVVVVRISTQDTMEAMKAGAEMMKKGQGGVSCKSVDVHDKSSDWGVQASTVPLDSYLSKKVGVKTKDKTPDANILQTRLKGILTHRLHDLFRTPPPWVNDGDDGDSSDRENEIKQLKAAIAKMPHADDDHGHDLQQDHAPGYQTGVGVVQLKLGALPDVLSGSGDVQDPKRGILETDGTSPCPRDTVPLNKRKTPQEGVCVRDKRRGNAEDDPHADLIRAQWFWLEGAERKAWFWHAQKNDWEPVYVNAYGCDAPLPNHGRSTVGIPVVGDIDLWGIFPHYSACLLGQATGDIGKDLMDFRQGNVMGGPSLMNSNIKLMVDPQSDLNFNVKVGKPGVNQVFQHGTEQQNTEFTQALDEKVAIFIPETKSAHCGWPDFYGQDTDGRRKNMMTLNRNLPIKQLVMVAESCSGAFDEDMEKHRMRSGVMDWDTWYDFHLGTVAPTLMARGYIVALNSRYFDADSGYSGEEQAQVFRNYVAKQNENVNHAENVAQFASVLIHIFRGLVYRIKDYKNAVPGVKKHAATALLQQQMCIGDEDSKFWFPKKKAIGAERVANGDFFQTVCGDHHDIEEVTTAMGIALEDPEVRTTYVMEFIENCWISTRGTKKVFLLTAAGHIRHHKKRQRVDSDMEMKDMEEYFEKNGPSSGGSWGLFSLLFQDFQMDRAQKLGKMVRCMMARLSGSDSSGNRQTHADPATCTDFTLLGDQDDKDFTSRHQQQKIMADLTAVMVGSSGEDCSFQTYFSDGTHQCNTGNLAVNLPSAVKGSTSYTDIVETFANAAVELLRAGKYDEVGVSEYEVLKTKLLNDLGCEDIHLDGKAKACDLLDPGHCVSSGISDTALSSFISQLHRDGGCSKKDQRRLSTGEVRRSSSFGKPLPKAKKSRVKDDGNIWKLLDADSSSSEEEENLEEMGSTETAELIKMLEADIDEIIE